jgi:hypothetical protein
MDALSHLKLVQWLLGVLFCQLIRIVTATRVERLKADKVIPSLIGILTNYSRSDWSSVQFAITGSDLIPFSIVREIKTSVQL